MRALIDGDVLLYTCAFAGQKTRYHVEYADGGAQWYDDAKSYKEFCKLKKISPESIIVTPHVNVLEDHLVQSIVRQRMEQILRAVDADSYVLFFTGEGNFRYEVAKTVPYKSNRTRPKPHHYAMVYDYLLQNYEHQVVEGIEADDGMAIEQSTSKQHTVICSIDKDLWQTPGYHFNWMQDEGQQKFKVSPEDGNRWFMQQLLSGDPTDTIPGLKGVGPKGAETMMLNIGSNADRWEHVLSLYKEKEGHNWESYLNEQGRHLWMLRSRDDFWTHTKFKEAINGQ